MKKLKKGGTPTTTMAAKFVLSEWNSGKIKFFTKVPDTSRSEHISDEAVAEHAKDFRCFYQSTHLWSALGFVMHGDLSFYSSDPNLMSWIFLIYEHYFSIFSFHSKYLCIGSSIFEALFMLGKRIFSEMKKSEQWPFLILEFF